MDLLSIICTMGLPTIEESMSNLVEAMADFPDNLLGSTEGMAKIIGAGIALGVGSYESWMMMIGRRGIDVMKILRILIISICITWSQSISEGIKSLTKPLESSVELQAKDKMKEVSELELKVAQKQSTYLKRLRAIQDSITNAQKIQEIGEDAGTVEEIMYTITNLGTEINNMAKRAAVAAETKISEWINDAIRFIGELIFQMIYYGMLVGQKIWMAILQSFCPLMFALSLAPPWRSAWSQWMSKFASVSLWGFVIYTCMYYVGFILEYNLLKDITAYDTLISDAKGTWDEVGTLGLQGIGSNCMYAMGMLVGARVLGFVPEVASWLIPGGVSSGLGGTAASTAMAGAGMAKSAATSATHVVGNTAGAIGSASHNYIWNNAVDAAKAMNGPK